MIDKIKLASVIDTYLLKLHTTPNNAMNPEYSRGWRDAANELIHSIQDDDGYVSTELNLGPKKQITQVTLERIQKGRQAVSEKGFNATDAVFKYPENDVLILGDNQIKCTKGMRDTGATIFGMKVWVDETITDECFYLLDSNQMIRSDEE